jgi:hypothetical protein
MNHYPSALHNSPPHLRQGGSGAPAHRPHIARPLASLPVRVRSLWQRGERPPGIPSVILTAIGVESVARRDVIEG